MPPSSDPAVRERSLLPFDTDTVRVTDTSLRDSDGTRCAPARRPLRPGTATPGLPGRSWWEEARWRFALAAWLAVPVVYPLARGPAAYLVADGRLHPVIDAGAFWPVSAARREGWLPDWYKDYLLRWGKAGRRAADERDRERAEAVRRDGEGKAGPRASKRPPSGSGSPVNFRPAMP